MKSKRDGQRVSPHREEKGLSTLTPREGAREETPWLWRKGRASIHILEVPEGNRTEPLSRSSGRGERWCDGQRAGEEPGESGQEGSISIPAPSPRKPRPREVRDASPCLRSHCLKEVKARVRHLPANKYFSLQKSSIPAHLGVVEAWWWL